MFIFVFKSPPFSINFHDNSKNKYLKIDFSFVSAHCASFVKMEYKLRGGGHHVLTWDSAVDFHIIFTNEFSIGSFIHFKDKISPCLKSNIVYIGFLVVSVRPLILARVLVITRRVFLSIWAYLLKVVCIMQNLKKIIFITWKQDMILIRAILV